MGETRKDAGGGEQRFSGTLAEEYDLITLAYPDFEAFQRRMIATIADHIDAAVAGGGAGDSTIAEPVRILEIGTGNGFTTRMLVELAEPFANREGPRVVVTSVDNDPEMLRQARKQIDTPLCTLVESDAAAFLSDQPEESWDVVASAFTIHNFKREYRDRVEGEIYRVLKRGGLFTNADKYAPDGQERFSALTFQIGRFFDAFLESGRTELLRKWVIHNIDDQSPEYVMFASEAGPRLRALGFDDVVVAHAGGAFGTKTVTVAAPSGRRDLRRLVGATGAAWLTRPAPPG